MHLYRILYVNSKSIYVSNIYFGSRVNFFHILPCYNLVIESILSIFSLKDLHKKSHIIVK